MKRFLKYAITLLVVMVFVHMTANAQTIKRSKQKTEQTQKSNNSTKNNTITPKSSKANNPKSNNNSSSKKNKSQKTQTAPLARSSSSSRTNNNSTTSPSTNPATRPAEQKTYPVSFSCNVKNAELYVDGELLGTANGKYNLKSGTYSIVIKFPGYFDNMDAIKVSSSSAFHYNLVSEAIIKRLIDDMVLIPGGEFTMGATREQGKGIGKNEKPTHKVTLSNYYISKYEVSQELWLEVMGTNPSHFKGNLRRPVENISWDDCQEFITKLNQITGKRFRLPTEAEWEYAARGGDKSENYKYAGSKDLNYVAWFYDNSRNMTHPVGCKMPNELGLYDMSGNVSEWCQDWYGLYGKSSQSNPTGPSYGSLRINRGGSWYNYADYCKTSIRNNESPEKKNDYCGLRLAASSL